VDQYPLRNIDDALWHAVRVRTTTDGISVKDVIVRALQLYAEHGKAALWSTAAPLLERRDADRKKARRKTA